MAQNTNTKNGHAENNLQKIDAIRDIIFGQSMDEIHSKFSALEKLIAKQNTQLKSTILRLDQKIDDTVKLLKQENKKTLKASSEIAVAEIENLSAKMKKDSSALSKRIILQREKLDKNIRKTESEINSARRQIDTKLEKRAESNNAQLIKLFRAMADQLEK